LGRPNFFKELAMPKVDLTATKDFTYMTRRLTAGDPFQARNPLDARILTRVRKVAEVPVVRERQKVGEAPAPSPTEPKPKAAPKKAPAKKAKRKAAAKK
jgi:16S rRNA U1498 N3-methylase RsmE